MLAAALNRQGADNQSRRSLPGRALDGVLRLLRLKKAKAKSEPKARPRPRPSAAAEPSDERIWPPRRLAMCERLWGEGFVGPGGIQVVMDFLPLLGLSEKKSLLLLGAGLGGVGRTMVEQTGVWVTGYEGEPELAELGVERTRMTGMSKRAPVSYSDFEALRLKAKSFDAVVSLECLFTVSDKQSLFEEICQSLRVDGEFLYTDLVIAGAEGPDQALLKWAAGEPVKPHPWTMEKTMAGLGALNFDVRPAEDVTGEYRRRIFQGLFTFLAGTNKAELLDVVDDLVGECEFLGRRIEAMDRGALKVCRFHAIKLPDKRRPVV